ncbi:MAG: hypothetical protein R3F03_15050 [Opitutaceae bacterium]
MKSLFGSTRQFASYDVCPEIFIRFNGKKEYGPHKLEKIMTYDGINSSDTIEARFSDETLWRPRKYFLNLWDRIPPSAHSRKRLENEGIQFGSEISEAEARRLLKKKQRTKLPTKRQVSLLQQFGISLDSVTNREDANRLIAERKGRERKAEENAARARRQNQEAPQIEECRLRLEGLKARVGQLTADWHPTEPKDLNTYLDFLELIEEALEYARGFDIAELHSGPFYDPGTSQDYYLEINTDPTESEMKEFQAGIFLCYLRKGSDEFGHVKLLKKHLHSIVASPL